jgi:hypothetical protein
MTTLDDLFPGQFGAPAVGMQGLQSPSQPFYNPANIANGGDALAGQSGDGSTPQQRSTPGQAPQVGAQAGSSPTAQILATLRPNAVGDDMTGASDPVTAALATLGKAKTNGSRFGAFASGLSAGMGGEQARNAQIAQGNNEQNQNTIGLLKTMFDMNNSQTGLGIKQQQLADAEKQQQTENTNAAANNAETKRYHDIMNQYYTGLVNAKDTDATKEQAAKPMTAKDRANAYKDVIDNSNTMYNNILEGAPNGQYNDPASRGALRQNLFKAQYKNIFGVDPSPEELGQSAPLAPGSPGTPGGAPPSSTSASPGMLGRIHGFLFGDSGAAPAATSGGAKASPSVPAAQVPPTTSATPRQDGTGATPSAAKPQESSAQPTWRIIRNKQTGETALFNPLTKEMQPWSPASAPTPDASQTVPAL